MNVKTFGWWLILLGVLGLLGTCFGYVSLKDQVRHANLEGARAYTGYVNLDSLHWAGQAKAAERNQERLLPWMIGCGVVVLIGAGMCFAGGGASGPTKTCPQCAETVLAAAVVCKHCGAKLATDRGDSRPGSSYRALAKAAEDAERRGSKS